MADIYDLPFDAHTQDKIDYRAKLRKALGMEKRDLNPIKMSSIIEIVGMVGAICFLPAFPLLSERQIAINVAKIILPKYESFYHDGTAREYIDKYERKIINGDKSIPLQEIKSLGVKLEDCACCWDLNDQKYNKKIVEEAKYAARYISYLTGHTGLPSCQPRYANDIISCIFSNFRGQYEYLIKKILLGSNED